jgi:hypothetical protein
MLAAPARPIEVLVPEQFAYLTRDEALLAAAKRFAEQVCSQALKPDDDVSFPTGGAGKGSYFLDLRSYDPVAAAVALGVPLLVIQGGRDYQVRADKDFLLYEKALEGKAQTLTKLFPALNHLLVAGEGASTPKEYERLDHVDVDVINTIAAFARGPVQKQH